MAALNSVNEGHVPSYGNDIHTSTAALSVRKHFGDSCDVYFVWGGTAANVLGLRAVTQRINAILCPESAHINVHECGAPENFTGCKLIAVPTADGKLTPDLCESILDRETDAHHAQARVISISQATERGTVYSIYEIRAIADFAHGNGLLLHVDGARLANAAVFLGCGFKEMTFDAGVDFLSFGGTKNGLLFGEAIVFRDSSYAKDFPYIRMQGMQLYSKMRFVAAQFEAQLSDGLVFETAGHANKMAKLLSELLADLPGIEITQNVESNGVFACIPKHCVDELHKIFDFFVLDEERSEVRLMCSFDTVEDDVREFVAITQRVLKA